MAEPDFHFVPLLHLLKLNIIEDGQVGEVSFAELKSWAIKLLYHPRVWNMEGGGGGGGRTGEEKRSHG